VAVVAVLHMSHISDIEVEKGEDDEIGKDGMAVFTLRIVCPLIVIFGVYLAINGHISAGGGFQGGLAIAAFFVCRYLVCNISDISINRVILIEELIFISIIILSVLAVFLGVVAFLPTTFLPIFQYAYLILMNVFIGLKVACGFFILFYRFIAVEGR
jgi:multicomponent Na+:H+ antiporter subunit B